MLTALQAQSLHLPAYFRQQQQLASAAAAAAAAPSRPYRQDGKQHPSAPGGVLGIQHQVGEADACACDRPQRSRRVCVSAGQRPTLPCSCPASKSAGGRACKSAGCKADEHTVSTGTSARRDSPVAVVVAADADGPPLRYPLSAPCPAQLQSGVSKPLATGGAAEAEPSGVGGAAAAAAAVVVELQAALYLRQQQELAKQYTQQYRSTFGATGLSVLPQYGTVLPMPAPPAVGLAPISPLDLPTGSGLSTGHFLCSPLLGAGSLASALLGPVGLEPLQPQISLGARAASAEDTMLTGPVRGSPAVVAGAAASEQHTQLLGQAEQAGAKRRMAASADERPSKRAQQ